MGRLLGTEANETQEPATKIKEVPAESLVNLGEETSMINPKDQERLTRLQSECAYVNASA